MAEIVKITKNQPFVLYVPLVILNGDGSKEAVEAASISDTTVTISGGCEEMDMQYNSYLHYIVLSFGADDMQVGEYSVVISATLSTGRPFNLRIKRAFGIVAWDWQSNWHQYLIDDHIELTDQAFIAGVFNTDADVDRLKEELRQQKAATAHAQAEAEAAKAAWEQKAAELDGVAREQTLNNGIAAIRGDIVNLSFETATDSEIDSMTDAIINPNS